MNILYTCDNQYLSYLLVSLYSLVENTREPLHIYIGFENLSLQNQKRIDTFLSSYQNVSLTFLKEEKVTKILDTYHLPTWRDSRTASIRLFFRELLPDIEKLLYLDSDTILTSDIKNWASFSSSKPVSAVLDAILPKHYQDFIQKDTFYFNSGVLYLNGKAWDRENGTQKVVDCLQKSSLPLIYPDQDLLNLAFQNQIGLLEPAYNVFPHHYLQSYNHFKKLFPNYTKGYKEEDFLVARDSPKILHLLSVLGFRPWHQNNFHPFSSVFDFYIQKVEPTFEKEKVDYPFRFFQKANRHTMSYLQYYKSYLKEDCLDVIKEKVYKKN